MLTIHRIPKLIFEWFRIYFNITTTVMIFVIIDFFFLAKLKESK